MTRRMDTDIWLVQGPLVGEQSSSNVGRSEMEGPLAILFNSSPDGLLICQEKDDFILEVNARWAELFGHVRETMLGHTLHGLDLFQGSKAWPTVAYQFETQGFVRDLDLNVRCASGEIRPVRLSARAITWQGEPCRLVLVRDISKEQQLETELRDTTARLREVELRLAAILDITLDAIIGISPEQQIVLFNRASENMFHCSAADVLGHSMRQFMPVTLIVPSQRRNHLSQDFGAWRGKVKLSASTARRATGEEFLIEAAISSVDLLGQRFFFLAVRDITARRQSEAERKDLMEQLRGFSARLAEVEETQRRNIARELHDSAGHKLAALNLNLNLIRASVLPSTLVSVKNRIDDSVRLVDETAGSLRNLLTELRPPTLDELGLLATLQWYAEQFSGRARLPVTVLGLEPEPRLKPAVEIALFRVAQEALNNVSKHAGATSITITLESHQNQTLLTITDDGVGFDPQLNTNPVGWGLVTMRERAQAVGGQFLIESMPGQGTQVIVEVRR